VARITEIRMHTRFYSGNIQERGHLGDVIEDEKMVLKLELKK
jgi:hypothetical protein